MKLNFSNINRKIEQQMNDDAVMLGDLQDKMTELLKLKDQAAEINSSLKK